MNKIRFLAVVLTLPLFFLGCEEVEDPGILEKMQGETALVEHIDLSAVPAPEEVCVYAGILWERHPEEVAGVFLGDGFEKEGVNESGCGFAQSTDAKGKETVWVYAGAPGQGSSDGCLFFGSNDDRKICERSTGFEEMEKEYTRTGKISGREVDEQEETFLAGKEVVSGYLEQLGMEGYVLDTAALLDTKKKSYWMVWKQMVDGIPISDTLVHENAGKTVYNYRYSISNPDLTACDTSLKVLYRGKKLAEWENYAVTSLGSQLGKYPVIPASEAYKKVQERYPQEAAEREPCLERAELQYELVEYAGNEEKRYFYPVWVFGVCYKDEITGNPEWDYHLMDAVTGDYFTDIPTELQQ